MGGATAVEGEATVTTGSKAIKGNANRNAMTNANPLLLASFGVPNFPQNNYTRDSRE